MRSIEREDREVNCASQLAYRRLLDHPQMTRSDQCEAVAGGLQPCLKPEREEGCETRQATWSVAHYRRPAVLQSLTAMRALKSMRFSRIWMLLAAKYSSLAFRAPSQWP